MSADDELQGRDLRMIWKVLAVIGGIAAFVGTVALAVVPWAVGLNSADVEIRTKIEALDKRITELRRRVDRLVDK